MSKNFQEIPLSKVSTNPNNPRKNFMGPAFDELVASIREKGIIEPIIVRPISNGKADVHSDTYEVVAGERRFRAAGIIADGAYYRIPAVIRELSDEEAFDFMIIENLHREDLTGFEEAQSFKQYFEKKGKGSVPELAKRIGKSPGHIRKKIAVLSLPQNIVKAWEKEELTFSHLEQLRRLKNRGDMKVGFDYAIGKTYYRGEKPSKRELKEHIDNMAPSLDKAVFDIKEEGCKTCGQNSDVQKKEWEIESMKGPHCLDKTCFTQKQNNFLLKNWKSSKYRRSYGTNGFRFSENVNWKDYKTFERGWGPQPSKKCKTCESYLTIIYLDGRVDEGKTCFGDRNCYDSIGRKTTMEKIQTERQKREEIGGPRVTWHGEHFREEFLKKRIPEKQQEFEASHLKMAHLALFAFIKSDQNLLFVFKRETKTKDFHYDDKLFMAIEKMDLKTVQELMKKCALEVIMKPWPIHHAGRLAVAKHLGINLMKEFAVTREYLEKKTIKEIIEFGNKSKLFNSPKVIGHLKAAINKDKYEKCKKTELIDLFLKSGVDLVGKVPKEIALERK